MLSFCELDCLWTSFHFSLLFQNYPKFLVNLKHVGNHGHIQVFQSNPAGKG